MKGNGGLKMRGSGLKNKVQWLRKALSRRDGHLIWRLDCVHCSSGHPDEQSWILLLLLLSCFSRVWLCATPETAAHQAPPSLRFSRQEHWSGLPFPSPMHESENWKWSRSVVPNPQRPHGLQPTRFLRPWDFLGKNTGVGRHYMCWFFSYLFHFYVALNSVKINSVNLKCILKQLL